METRRGYYLMNPFKTGVLFCTFAFALLPAGCKNKPVTVSLPKISTEAAEYAAQGDARLRDAHLYGWRQAEAFYQKAYIMSPADEIRKKLLLARFLVLIRQIDEDIPYPETDEVIQDLCAGDPYQRNLCGVAEWIKNGRKAGQLKLNGSIFRGEDQIFDSYLNLLLFQATPRADAFPDSEIFIPYRESPLFLYLNIGKLTSMDPAEFEKKHPQFAEGYEILADHLYQKKKYRLARAFYQKAIDLIPEYTNALIGLGNIYFYVLEDYGRSTYYYDAALKRDPSSAAALFGKALVLQQLGSYQESNAVLDRMLGLNLARNKWIDGVADTQYYKGQGNYLKAYNYYLMKVPGSARDLVDLAVKYLPESLEIHYLSGLLFYDANELEPARKDFLRVASSGNCDAQLHLGFIYEQLAASNGNQPLPGEKEPASGKSAQYFVQTSGCLEAAIGSLSYQIRTMDLTELDPAEQTYLKNRMDKKLSDARLSSCSTIEMILDRISKKSMIGKDAFLKYLNEILARLRSK
jgi:tetratricopeptide (TPR) repeat protein